MSLFDALLEDDLFNPPAPAQGGPGWEIHIANRVDGKADPEVIGSGTFSDPYDGSSAAKFLNNRNPDGTLYQGYSATGVYAPELFTDVEDVFLAL